MNIAFGIAGWSYPDWTGTVYPPGIKDKLAYAARYVDLIEINSTFYRPPSTRDSASWLQRVGPYPDFYFTAKLHQDITHGGALEEGMAAQFHEGFRPLAEAGRLRHLLAQFKYDFNDTPGHREHLRRIRDRFMSLAHVTLELRHKSWQLPEALAFLESLEVTVTNLDYPLSQTAFSLQECNVGNHRYLRLHGRNRAAWFDKKAGRDETYNYLYSRAELEDIGRRAAGLAASAQSLTVVGNNHYQGKELANILQLKSMLINTKIPVPPLLIGHYPDLKDIALPENE
ncbi:MAG: DUF72 domain-containing protein [Verrucomicrobia bacterium]|nr:DUF72 domain-containing protein [Verrucomicrobiota bacterium]MBU4291539.1 DUF72 domain-containing protein [Verrucomicrobiota bacterium]MBU4429108.1 DUF72 domain-containing protein [Verrucomicrobiota bacterium]MCG2678628.1 DUF72 domain-containing protein [Kiritimatiellia bacterium]